MMVVNARHDQVRSRALEDMRRFEVVMQGHFDYGNGFHGRLYLNPHQLFQWPPTIWRVAQDLIDVMPAELIEDRKSTRLNSSHGYISYAVFCLKKKTQRTTPPTQ